MREFDDIIRQKLEGLPADGTPDWTDLQNRLEGDAFDSLLRGQLASSSSLTGADKVAPAIVGWDALSSKLDVAAEVEGDVFDRILSQKLNTAETALEPEASWKVLSHRMDTLWPLRKVLVRYRVLEMAAAIALLLTFAPLLRDNPITIGTNSPVASATGKLEALPQRSVLLTRHEAKQFLQPEEIATLIYSENSRTPENLSLNNASLSSQEASSSESAASASSSLYSPFALLQNALDWFTKHSSSGLTMMADRSHAHQLQTFSSKITSGVVSSEASVFPVLPSGNNQVHNLEALDLLTLTEFDASENKPPFISLPKMQTSPWEVGAHAGLRAWNIATPVDMEFQQQASTRWQGGVSVGVSANRMLGARTALGLGVSLTPLNYDPGLPKVFDQADVNSSFSFSRAETFNAISVNIAQIPVDFRLRLTPKAKRTSIWAFGGLAANFALSSSYDLQQEYGFSIDRNGLNPPTGSGLEELPSGPAGEPVIEAERTFSDAKNFAPGILERGGFAGNTFFSARLGLEASHELNDKVSIFSSLSYNQHLPLTSKFGPNNDRLSSAGLNLGARISL